MKHQAGKVLKANKQFSVRVKTLLGLLSGDFSYFNLDHVHGGPTPSGESGEILGHFGDHDRGVRTQT